MGQNTKQDDTQSLFDFAKHLRNKYDEIEAITAENFNVFSILRLDSDEIQHSRILAELLNPKGSHQQGGKFLEAFVTMFCNIKFVSYDNVEVVTEKYLGKIDNDKTEGGFIDICISDKTNTIAIENKIYAGDQTSQLFRYYNSTTDFCREVLYLTLEGTPPSEQSIKTKDGEKILEMGTNYRLISYKKDIKEWLEYCLKEVALVPLVRETIHQYLNLIKKMTGQSLNHQFVEEMKEELKKNDNFMYVPSIIKAYEALKKDAQDFFWEKLSGILKTRPEPLFISEVTPDGKKDCRDINLGELSGETLKFRIVLDKNGFYFSVKKETNNGIPVDVLSNLKTELGKKSFNVNTNLAPDSIAWKYPEKNPFDSDKFNSTQIEGLIKNWIEKDSEEQTKPIAAFAEEIIREYGQVKDVIKSITTQGIQ